MVRSQFDKARQAASAKPCRLQRLWRVGSGQHWLPYISLNINTILFIAYKYRVTVILERARGRRAWHTCGYAHARCRRHGRRVPVTRCAAVPSALRVPSLCTATAQCAHRRSCSLNDPLKLAVPLGQRGRVGTRRARRLAPQQGTAPCARARSGGWAVASRRGRLRAAVGTCH